jgi:hypothetical protein
MSLAKLHLMAEVRSWANANNKLKTVQSLSAVLCQCNFELDDWDWFLDKCFPYVADSLVVEEIIHIGGIGYWGFCLSFELCANEPRIPCHITSYTHQDNALPRECAHWHVLDRFDALVVLTRLFCWFSDVSMLIRAAQYCWRQGKDIDFLKWDHISQYNVGFYHQTLGGNGVLHGAPIAAHRRYVIEHEQAAEAFVLNLVVEGRDHHGNSAVSSSFGVCAELSRPTTPYPVVLGFWKMDNIGVAEWTAYDPVLTTDAVERAVWRDVLQACEHVLTELLRQPIGTKLPSVPLPEQMSVECKEPVILDPCVVNLNFS